MMKENSPLPGFKSLSSIAKDHLLKEDRVFSYLKNRRLTLSFQWHKQMVETYFGIFRSK